MSPKLGMDYGRTVGSPKATTLGSLQNPSLGGLSRGLFPLSTDSLRVHPFVCLTTHHSADQFSGRMFSKKDHCLYHGASLVINSLLNPSAPFICSFVCQ